MSTASADAGAGVEAGAGVAAAAGVGAGLGSVGVASSMGTKRAVDVSLLRELDLRGGIGSEVGGEVWRSRFGEKEAG